MSAPHIPKPKLRFRTGLTPSLGLCYLLGFPLLECLPGSWRRNRNETLMAIKFRGVDFLEFDSLLTDQELMVRKEEFPALAASFGQASHASPMPSPSASAWPASATAGQSSSASQRRSRRAAPASRSVRRRTHGAQATRHTCHRTRIRRRRSSSSGRPGGTRPQPPAAAMARYRANASRSRA